ncbi:TetR/AcrR family transcriptional regulator [bacterium SCSIO 12696]|nr:TetR/AcrR family transcriptional regulator [bacterium SCSIO 12696]
MKTSRNSSTEKILEKKRRFLAREEGIVEAALALLLERGVDRVTVSDIAHSAGIGKGTVYKHFLTKNEILMRIVMDYERRLSESLNAGIERARNGEPGAAAMAYFQWRLSNPSLDRLVQQLEMRLEAEPEMLTELKELHSLRHSNMDSLNSMVEDLIKEGRLENVPPHHHYLACWALAQGAVELFFNKTLDILDISDKRELLNYITSIGVTMGNRGQLKG